MTDIYARFAALPRARRGTTSVVIVDEEVLATLIADAQTSEARLFEQGIKRAPRTRTPASDDWPTRGNRDYLLHGRPTDTQANEIHGLTPLPLHEQVPGAWNFVEPQSGRCPCGSNLHGGRGGCSECR